MELIRTSFIVWGLFGFLTTMIGIVALRTKAVDCEIKISGALSLSYGVLTALSAWLAIEPLPSWWPFTVVPIGLFIIILSQVLSFWAKCTLGRDFSPNLAPSDRARLVTDGPFEICRHPMMLSYLMLWLGTALVLGSIMMSVSFGFASILVMRRVALEERALATSFGDRFQDYKNRTSLMTPFAKADSEEARAIDRAVEELAEPNWIKNLWKCR